MERTERNREGEDEDNFGKWKRETDRMWKMREKAAIEGEIKGDKIEDSEDKIE